MMRRVVILGMVIVLLGSVLALASLNRATPFAAAQSEPVGDGMADGTAAVVADFAPAGDPAVWSINESTFTSNYPNGFTVKVQASSEAGAIERARLIWHRSNLRENQNLFINAEEAQIDPVTNTITARWEPDSRQMIPPWVLISFHWELRDSDGNAISTDSELAEYADTTREWSRFESDEAVVFASDLPGDIEQQVLDAMAQQYDKYLTVWRQPLPYRPRIILFGNYDAWLEWRTADRPSDDGNVVVGQTFDSWGAIVQVLFGTEEEDYIELAYSTVVHEVEHLYQSEFWSGRRRGDIPRWFIEGDATFFELYQGYDYEERARAVAESYLPPLMVDTASAERIFGTNTRDGYDVGYTFFVWLQEHSGGTLDMHRDLMGLLMVDVLFFDAVQTVTGLSAQEVESAWRSWLGISPVVPTLVPTPTLKPLLPSPTPFQPGS